MLLLPTPDIFVQLLPVGHNFICGYCAIRNGPSSSLVVLLSQHERRAVSILAVVYCPKVPVESKEDLSCAGTIPKRVEIPNRIPSTGRNSVTIHLARPGCNYCFDIDTQTPFYVTTCSIDSFESWSFPYLSSKISPNTALPLGWTTPSVT